jgi:hypothetical protein
MEGADKHEVTLVSHKTTNTIRLMLPRSRHTGTKNYHTGLSSTYLNHSDTITGMNMSPNSRSLIQPSITKHISQTQISNSINLPPSIFIPIGSPNPPKLKTLVIS